MPWFTSTTPSIALGILAELCNEKSIAVKTFYPNFDMEVLLGSDACYHFANDRPLYGLSEHLFAADIFGKDNLNSDKYLDILTGLMQKDEGIKSFSTQFTDKNYLAKVRDEVIPSFLESILKRVLAESPTVVGFTATFNQVMSSIALSNRIKYARPDVQTIVGGASFHGTMGQHYHMAFNKIIDHVFVGEAEDAFREYLSSLQKGETNVNIPNVTNYDGTQVTVGESCSNVNLDQSPRPDYDDFFLEKDRIQKENGKVLPTKYVYFESSRGCWWGQKSHCLFCGNNEDLIEYRSKNVDRVIDDIITLSARYKADHLAATDWILSQKDCDELFRRLKELDMDIELFYETRPIMRKSQIIQMKQAGIVHIQPGIESFSTPILKIMRKGTTALGNIQFLRWCKEAGVGAHYNILTGLPGDQESWYIDMANLMIQLQFLQPPNAHVQKIEMHRFSPLFDQRERYDVDSCDLRPDYYLNFPKGFVDPMEIAYFFTFQSSRICPNREYGMKIETVIRDWRALHMKKYPPVYDYRINPGFLRITDSREGRGKIFNLSDIYQDIVLLCDEIQTRETLARDLNKLYKKQIEDGTFDSVIDELINSNILIKEGVLLLTLPIGHRARTTEQLRSYVLGKEADKITAGPPVLS